MMRVVVTAALVAACGTKPPAADPAPPATTPPPATTAPAEVAPVDWSRSGIDWSKPPAAGAERPFEVPTPATFRLANGMQVVVVENRRLPLVSTRLIVRGAGSAADPPGKEGLAGLTADLLDEGVTGQSALEFTRAVETAGAYLATGVDADAAILALDGIAATFADGLALLRRAVAPPGPWTDFARIHADRLSALRRRRDRPRTVAALILDKVVFGGHPYGHPNNGYLATVDNLTEADAVGFFRAHYRPDRATLIVVGDIDADAARRAAADAFAGFTAKPAARKKPARRARKRGGKKPRGLPRARLPRLVVVDKPEAAQTEVVIGRVLMTRTDPRFFPTRVANTVLGGSFTSRLNRRLREELGYTYGAGSRMWMGATTGTWYARSALKTANTIDGVKEALRLIDGMRTADVPAAELTRAKQLLVRALPDQFASNRAIAGAFADLVSEGVDLGWHRSFGDGIRGVTAAQVRERAAATWSADQLVVIAVGDLKAILPGLLGLGLGPALELDAEGAVLRTHPAAE